MTLEKTLRQQLNDSGKGGFHVTADGWTVTVASEKGDTLSCALNELALDHGTPVQQELRAWAERVADRATGLMEPLRVVEIDTSLGTAMLRSETPTAKDGKSQYYELLLTRTNRSTAKLRRYAASSGEKRESVPFVLTHDAIVKLVNDIVGN